MAMGVDVLVCTPFDFGDLNILCFRIVIMLIYKTGGTWRLGVHPVKHVGLCSSGISNASFKSKYPKRIQYTVPYTNVYLL